MLGIINVMFWGVACTTDKTSDTTEEISLTAGYANCAIRQEHDAGIDGNINSAGEGLYGEHGELIYWEEDDENDGVFERSSTWNYDGDGNMLTYAYDYDHDGVDDSTETHTWEDGLLVYSEREVPDDTDLGSSTDYTYNSDGRLIALYKASNNVTLDPLICAIEWLEEDGVLVSTWTCEDSRDPYVSQIDHLDGNDDLIYQWRGYKDTYDEIHTTYSARGLPTNAEWNYTYDGELQNIIFTGTEYDEALRRQEYWYEYTLLYGETDFNTDAARGRSLYTYDCP